MRRKLTEGIVMLLALAACGSDDGTEAADSPAKELPEAGTSAPATSTGTAGKPATPATTPSRAGSGAAPSRTPAADAGSKSTAPSSTAGATAAPSGGASGSSNAGGSTAAAGGADAANAAGSAGAATEPTGSEQGVPCEVSKALAAACQRCHGTVPANGAPMALVTLEDFETLTVGGRPRVPKYQAALDRMNGTKGPPMPPATSPITDADKQTLIDWLGEGAPAGDACP